MTLKTTPSDGRVLKSDRPLSPMTLARIRRGIDRFLGHRDPDVSVALIKR